MKPIKVTLPRYAPMYGWRNRILRVDLSEGRIWAQEATPYVPDFIGGRGLAAKILWDEYPEPVDAYDPRNPFMVVPGALTGTRSPFSGRSVVCAFSPQSYPYTWFTRASIGLDWGATLKRAGYDALVVTGASDTPVQLVIQDDEVSLLPADDLWGLDTLETQERTKAAYGKSARTLTMGPAGENLSRIATVHTGSNSVAGQGGFGAVLGSKKLKAITAIASERVPVADPERLNGLYKVIGEELRSQRPSRSDWLTSLNERLQQDGGGAARLFSCTENCPVPCGVQFSDIQGVHFDRKWSGAQTCVSGIFRGMGKGLWLYEWDLGLRGGFEMQMYANALGINHWEMLVGIVPWLRACEREGVLKEINGRRLEWNSPAFWAGLLHDLAYREGLGDTLAEGGYRAALQLDLGVDLMRRYYTGWGYSGHWDGHAAFVNYVVYPFWIVGALHWALDTRDPASSTHCYVQNVMYQGPFRGQEFNPEAPIQWEHMRGIGERLYGRADTLDPFSGYEGKAIPAVYHGVRSLMKDALPSDDQRFPLIYSRTSEDRFCRIEDPAGGLLDGPDVDAHLLRAGTGVDWGPPEFQHAAERAYNLERANVVRHWGRDRHMDERVIPAFEYQENWTSPMTGERHALDRAQFLPLLDEYYRLAGWDAATGWPTRERLEELQLGDVYDEMIAGAQAAKARLPELPPEEQIRDIHAHDPEREDVA